MSLDPEEWTEEEIKAFQNACDLVHEYLKTGTVLGAINGTPTYAPHNPFAYFEPLDTEDPPE